VRIAIFMVCLVDRTEHRGQLVFPKSAIFDGVGPWHISTVVRYNFIYAIALKIRT